ncbi:hypothetical protein Daesc_003896 [Daldinia eschscholtzii]|uniref:Uncharacterized protein n=1 Tax=Daldinia eschscholtzii TaxID=292717 RepID=A0AAX6MN65_9PEZI
MPFALKNIFYTPQRFKAEQHVKRGFGKHSSLIKEVVYDEDEDDGTPCLLIIFWSSRAFSFFGELEQAKHNIEKDLLCGLERFRIDSKCCSALPYGYADVLDKTKQQIPEASPKALTSGGSPKKNKGGMLRRQGL